MVSTPVDITKPPVITLSQAEIEEIEELIAADQLPRDYLERHFAAVKQNVFGHDHKVDAKGNPIEQGKGSAMNQTRQSVDAYRKWGVNEIDYERHLKRMEAELAKCDERRRAEGAGRPRQRINR
jgi:hypothetical protein